MDWSRKAVPPEDGIIATNLNRKASAQIVKYLARTKVTPNQVTVVSLIVGLLGGLLFFKGTYIYLVIGAIILEISVTLDCVDGGLARVKGMCSEFGQWLENLADRLVEITALLGLSVGQFRISHDPRVLILGSGAIATVFLVTYNMAYLGRLSGEALSKRRNLARKMSRRLRLGRLMKPGYLSFQRDAQIFLIFLGCILNQVTLLLLALIILGNIHWIVRTSVYWRFLDKKA